MKNKELKKDDEFLIEYINDTKYGKIAHFFSINEGNHYSRVIENNDFKILIYDRLSKEEEQDFITNIDINEYEEV